MLAYAIHTIRRRVEDQSRVEDAKTIFECEAAEFAELKALGAVREPDETETVLYGLANGPAPVPTPVVETPNPFGLKPKRVGAGKFVVIDKNDDPVNTGLEEPFDSKAAAEAWITAELAKPGDADDTLLG